MKKKLLYLMMLAVVVMSMFSFAGCTEKASDYSEEEHFERVSALVEKRYIQDNEDYTGYKLYPLYNENDKLAFFLVDLEPRGYVYIQINEKDLSKSGGRSMYTRGDNECEIWRRYTVEIGHDAYMTNKRGQLVLCEDTKWITDENGEITDYYDSHFKAANIGNEQRYLLKIYQNGSYGYIPAVKRGERYLNLVSMELMDYESQIEEKKYAIEVIGFIPKAEYNL